MQHQRATVRAQQITCASTAHVARPVLALEATKAGTDVGTIRDDAQAMKVEFTMAEYNERVAKFWNELQPAINEVINREHPTHEDYQEALGWIYELGQTNEAPLFIANFFENVVEKSAHAGLPGSGGDHPRALLQAGRADANHEALRHADETRRTR